jgi:K+-sensing histidine kinase KdpD
MLITMNDFTTQLNLQEVKNKTLVLKTFQCSISHNVRSPISSISVLAKLLIKKLKHVSPDAMDMLNAIYSASNLAHFLMQDLLDY